MRVKIKEHMSANISKAEYPWVGHDSSCSKVNKKSQADGDKRAGRIPAVQFSDSVRRQSMYGQRAAIQLPGRPSDPICEPFQLLRPPAASSVDVSRELVCSGTRERAADAPAGGARPSSSSGHRRSGEQHINGPADPAGPIVAP